MFGVSFLRLQVSSSCGFGCLPPVGEVGSVACVGFLVEGIDTIFWWVGLDLVFWWAELCLVVCFGMSVNLV